MQDELGGVWLGQDPWPPFLRAAFTVYSADACSHPRGASCKPAQAALQQVGAKGTRGQ